MFKSLYICVLLNEKNKPPLNSSDMFTKVFPVYSSLQKISPGVRSGTVKTMRGVVHKRYVPTALRGMPLDSERRGQSGL